MSGAEVAGFVLSVIPLVVSGLEYYGEGVRIIRKVKNSAAEFSKMRQTLEVQHQIFLNSLEQLFKDDVDERQLAAMLSDVTEMALWAEPEIDKVLHYRLGRSYSAYTGGVRGLADSIKEFKDALQLGPDGKGPFILNKVSVGEALKRLRFGLKMRAYAQLMEDIVRQNQALCQLTQQSSHLEPVRESRRKIPDFHKARNHARSMFDTLQRAFSSSCSATHRASLYMRSLQAGSHDKYSKPDPSRYRVILHHEMVTTAKLPSPWSIAEAEIQSLDDDDTPGDHGRHVRFQTTPATVTLWQQQQNMKEIRDLCLTIQQLQASRSSCDSCLGYLADMVNKCHHSLYWPYRPLVDKTCTSPMTLAQVLDSQQGYRLGQTDKRYLALALASGMLRLHKTPWLAQQWGKNEVILFQNKGGIVASHPFISASLSMVQKAPLQPTYFIPCRPIKEETLFALGVILIELAMEQPFENMVIPEDLRPDGTKHELSDFYTADRLVELVYLRAGDRYGDVVRRCIRCEFDQKKSSLDDPAFCRKVYEGVVAQLELDIADLVNL